MTYAEALAMTQDDRITRLKFEADTQQRAFINIGKLYDCINSNLPKGKFINPTLEAAGVKPGTISNASYAARCYREFVATNHLGEDEYNNLSFNDMFNLIRVCSDKSKRKLTPAEAVAIGRNGDFEDDLKSIFETGLTSAEKEAVEAKIKADKEAAEAAAKIKAEQQAAELEEVKKRNEELAKANAEMTAQAAAASTPTTPAPAPAAPAPAATPAPAEPAPEPAAPVAVVTAPEADAPATAEDLLQLLDEVENALALLAEDEQGIVGARLVEMASRFVDSGKSVKKAKAKAA